jgi:hypothetical protein
MEQRAGSHGGSPKQLSFEPTSTTGVEVEGFWDVEIAQHTSGVKV